MKKIVFILIVFLCLIPITAFAQNEISSPDLSAADNALLQEDYSYLMPSEILKSILKNEFSISGETLFNSLINALFKAFKTFLPEILSIFAVSVVISVISKLEIINEKFSSMALLGGRIIICVNLLTSFIKISKTIKNSITVVVEFFQKILPAMCTVFAFSGAQNGAASLQGSASILTFLLLKIVCGAIITFIISSTVILSINSLLPDNKLKGIGNLLSSASSWLLSGAFTLFCGFSAITGITAAVSDNMRLRSLKYAVGASLPVIGGSVSESLNFVIAGARCLKSALGITGVIVIFVLMLSPILNLLAIMLLLKFFAAICSAWTDRAIVEIIEIFAGGYKMLLITLVGVCAVFFLFLGVFSCAGGAV